MTLLETNASDIVDQMYRADTQMDHFPQAVTPVKVMHSFGLQSLQLCTGGAMIVTGTEFTGDPFHTLSPCTTLYLSTMIGVTL